MADVRLAYTLNNLLTEFQQKQSHVEKSSAWLFCIPFHKIATHNHLADEQINLQAHLSIDLTEIKNGS